MASNGELKFLSSNNQDIVFQPGGSGRLVLNGVPIQDASKLKGEKVRICLRDDLHGFSYTARDGYLVQNC